MIVWCHRVLDHCEMNRETAAIAMNCLDRFLMTDTGMSIAGKSLRNYQLAAMTSLYTAIKIHEPEALSPELLIQISHGLYSQQEFECMELLLLQSLQWRVNPPTTMAFVRQFMELLAPCDDFTFEVLSKLSNVQAELALENHDFIAVESSLIAYCALINAIACSGIDPHGNMTSTLKHAFRNMSDKQIDQDSETVLSQVQEALFQSLVQHPVAQNIIYSSEVALAAQNQSAELLRNNTICHASGNENCVADKSSHRVSPSASPRSVSFCL